MSPWYSPWFCRQVAWTRTWQEPSVKQQAPVGGGCGHGFGSQFVPKPSHEPEHWPCATKVQEPAAKQHAPLGCTPGVGGPATVAIVPLGYADGVPRRLGLNGGEVLIGGVRRPIRGVVTMDQTIVEVTGGPEVRAGDPVVLLGAQGDDALAFLDAQAAEVGELNRVAGQRCEGDAGHDAVTQIAFAGNLNWRVPEGCSVENGKVRVDLPMAGGATGPRKPPPL